MHNYHSRILLLIIIVFTFLSLYLLGCGPKSQADFIVQNIQWEPKNPIENDFVTFSITISNIGSGDASTLNPINVTLYIDGANFGSNEISSVSAGKSKTVSLLNKWQAVSKCHEIKAVVNSNDIAKETNKDNNTKSEELCVRNRLIWRRALIDCTVIYSSPVLEEGNIFVASGNNILFCLNSETGELVWEKSVGIDFHNSSMNTLFSSPTVFDGKVYIHAYDGDIEGPLSAYLICLSANSGNLLWKQLVYTWPSSFDSLPYSGSSPAVYNEKVYLVSGEYLYCFNANDGKLIWKYETNSPVHSSPAFYQGKLYISLQGIDYLGCFDAENGKLLWKYKIGEKLGFIPVFYTTAYNGRVYACSLWQGLYCLNAENGDLLWKKDNIEWSSRIAYLEVYEKRLYVGTRDVYSFDSDSGTLIWHYVLPNDCLQSPLTIIDRNIYFGSFSGTLYCINADKGTRLRSYKAKGEIWSKPLIYQDKVYFGARDTVYCISANDN